MTARHKWVKLKTHHYLCKVCGTGKRNAQDLSGGEWLTSWHRADGQVIISALTPPCERGRLTDERLEWLAARKMAE